MLPADRAHYGSNGEYFPLELMVVFMFLFQALRVGSLVYRQCVSDIFLIDWEKVNSVSLPRSLRAGDAMGVRRWL